ncbi:MAG: ABC transporter ATP-binding protein [Jatrophihabitantaceae bacterium]
MRFLSCPRREGRLRAARAYLATIGPLSRLVWRSSPPLLLASTGLMLLTGVLPAANIVVVSALLQTLVDANQNAPAGHAGLAGAPHFVLLLVVLASINLVGQLADRLAQVVSELHGTRIANQVQLLIADKAGRVDLASFEDRTFHNRMRTIADEAPYRPREMLELLMHSVASFTTLLSLGAILLFWHPWLVLALVLAAAPTLWISTWYGGAQVELISSRAENERRRQYLNTLLVSDQPAKEIRLFGLRGLLFGRLGTLLEQIYRQNRGLAVRELRYSLPAGLLLAGVQVALIAYTAVQALHGDISVGRFNQYMLAVVQLGALLPSLAGTVGSLHESNLYASRLFGFLATAPSVEAPRAEATRETAPSVEAPSLEASGAEATRETAPAIEVAGSAGRPPRIVFEQVSFRYPGTDRTVLTDLSFTVDPGESIALVGNNGAGKSTVVKLLAGLYQPTAGRILLDGVDIAGLDRQLLRANLSVVFQDFVVYHFSAWDNVGFGQLSRLHDRPSIEAAARQSGLDGVVRQLPDGYDTVLGRFWEKGHELSGGQRQLVALARALLRQAPVLVLDEPSAALDVRAERVFFERLLDNGSEPRRSTILISHRYSTVRRAGRILVLKAGRLAEQGSHAELMRLAGEYAEMFRLHSAAYQPAAYQSADYQPADSEAQVAGYQPTAHGDGAAR